jgi:hypothetical protein
MVYFASPYRDSKRQPLGQKAATLHFTTKLSVIWVSPPNSLQVFQQTFT